MQSADSPVFSYSMPGVATVGDTPHLSVRGLAAPSRGSTQTCVWRLTIAGGTPPRFGTVDHEEIFHVLSGAADVQLAEDLHHLAEGDTLIVPPDTTFGISNPHDASVEFVVVLPVGGVAHVPGEESFTPPWAQ
ncbi:cupin domain-containing protein [Streptomyces sp. NPDC049813]|uniref:cupin domain-containing protein n=1 Tax=Streptomyces sp. NPDC049813 TaxID=3365597 RepID=UPI00379693E7